MSKKILYVHHTHNLGGAPRSLSYIMECAVKDGFDVQILIPKRPGNEALKNLFLATGAKVCELKAIRPFHGSTIAPSKTLFSKFYSVIGLLIMFFKIYSILKFIRPDIVHVNSTCLVGASLASKFYSRKIKTIAHVREPLLTNYWGRLLLKLNLISVDRFIAIDTEGQRSLGASCNNSCVIYNSVEPNYFNTSELDREEYRKKLGLNPREFVLIYCARVVPANGLLKFVKSFNDIRRKLNVPVRLLAVGFNTKEKTSYETQCIDAMIDGDFAIDFISNPHEMICAADLNIAPFVSSHSARSIFEAAALGIPSIVTDLPNLVELIQPNETGLVFDLEDSDTLYEAIRYIIINQSEMSQSARVRCLQNHELNKNYGILKSIYLS